MVCRWRPAIWWRGLCLRPRGTVPPAKSCSFELGHSAKGWRDRNEKRNEKKYGRYRGSRTRKEKQSKKDTNKHSNNKKGIMEERQKRTFAICGKEPLVPVIKLPGKQHRGCFRNSAPIPATVAWNRAANCCCLVWCRWHRWQPTLAQWREHTCVVAKLVATT